MIVLLPPGIRRTYAGFYLMLGFLISLLFLGVEDFFNFGPSHPNLNICLVVICFCLGFLLSYESTLFAQKHDEEIRQKRSMKKMILKEKMDREMDRDMKPIRFDKITEKKRE